MSIDAKTFSNKIKELMDRNDTGFLQYIRPPHGAKKYIQYCPNKGNQQVWGNKKCHFEFLINGTKDNVSSCDIVFHTEEEFDSSARSSLGRLIGKCEKFDGLSKGKISDVENACITYKTIDIGEADPDVKAKEAVDAMVEFYQKYGDEILGLIELSRKPKEQKQMNFITLLLNNHNVILHGAPGTGKTYLAKKIAKEMIFGDAEKALSPEEQEQFNERCGFVQFHQSYDYTDFVEGLRPVNQDQSEIGFELKDGVFKAFCKKALNFVVPESLDGEDETSASELKITESSANSEHSSEVYDDEEINQGVEKLKEELRGKPNRMMTIPGVRRNVVTLVLVGDDIRAKAIDGRRYQEKIYNTSPGKIKRYIKTGEYALGHDTYEPAIGQYILDHFMPPTIRNQIGTNVSSNSTTPIPPDAFVFIIDEINRGEMSKIFGELFFSIDPGYRGEKGKIKTQYQNLIDTKDSFADGFFIPKNVYIIGTMNDIDRSVESMDFAMRRRFAFKEIEAKDRIEMLDEIKEDKLKKLAIAKMNALNIAIEKTEGLSSAYHIGPAYFLKLDKYGGDFDKLWKFHIEGVVHEYLRGMDDAKGKQEKIETAYKEAIAE